MKVVVMDHANEIFEMTAKALLKSTLSCFPVGATAVGLYC